MNPIKESAAAVREECQGCGRAGLTLVLIQVGPNLFTLCQGCTARLSAEMADKADDIPLEEAPDGHGPIDEND